MDRFKLTPTNSNIDSIMEKFRIEFGNAVEEDQSNNRRITISSPIKYNSNHTCDIDKQIEELEETIQKLQNEITDLNRNDNTCIPNVYDINKKSYIIKENKDPETVVNNIGNDENTDVIVSETEQCNLVFPLFIPDVTLPLNDGGKPIDAVVSELLTVDADNNNDEIDTVKQEVLNLWNDLKDYAPKNNIDELINDLQTEISEKLETLKDDEFDESCNSKKD